MSTEVRAVLAMSICVTNPRLPVLPMARANWTNFLRPLPTLDPPHRPSPIRHRSPRLRSCYEIRSESWPLRDYQIQ